MDPGCGYMQHPLTQALCDRPTDGDGGMPNSFYISIKTYKERKPVIGQHATSFKLVNRSTIFQRTERRRYQATDKEQTEELLEQDNL